MPQQPCWPVSFPPLARYYGAAQSGAVSPPPPPPPPLQACCLAWSAPVHQPGSARQRLVGSNLAEEKREEEQEKEREEERDEVGEEEREAADRCSPLPAPCHHTRARAHAVCGSHYSVDERWRVERRIRVNEPGLTTWQRPCSSDTVPSAPVCASLQCRPRLPAAERVA